MMYNIEYLNDINPDIVKNICATLNCDVTDVCNIEPMKIGLTNFSFKFDAKGFSYVYRHPGKGTETFLNRKREEYAERIAKEIELNKTSIIVHPTKGWKISNFVESFTYPNPHDKEDQKLSMNLIKKLHDKKIISPWDFDYIKEADIFIESFENDVIDLDIHKRMKVLSAKLDGEGFEKVLCHNDFWQWNILKGEDGVNNLIDWEYAGNAYTAVDVAYFTCNEEFTDEEYIKLAEIYEGHTLSDKEKRFYFANLAIVMWYWFVWAEYKEILGRTIDDKDLWNKKAMHALEVSEKMYKEIDNESL